nr:uncharacterized LOC104090695 isoform X1 [Nicotiana tomentosiformis]
MAADVACCGTKFSLYILAVIGLVLFAGLMAGLTLGLMSLGLVDLEVLSKSGRPQDRLHASKILPVVKNQHLLLCTLLIGNSLAMESLPIFLDKLVPSWAAILVSVTLILMFGEIIPQAICTRYGLTVGATVAPFVQLLLWLFFPIAYPISKVLDWMLGKGHAALLRRAELKTFMDFHGNEAGKGGDLTHDETTIIAGALQLTEKTAKNAMTPISKAFSLDLDGTLNLETLNAIMTMGHSRVPVYYRKPTNIIGLILVKNLLAVHPGESVPLRKMMIRKIPRVSENMPLYDILNEFQKGHSHIAVVYKDLNEMKDTPVNDKDADNAASKSNLHDTKTGFHKADDDQVTKKSPPPTPAFKKRHRGCSFCILDLENTPIPEIPPDQEVVGVITMEDVIEELLQEEILDETDEYVNIHNRIKVNMNSSLDFSEQNSTTQLLETLNSGNVSEFPSTSMRKQHTTLTRFGRKVRGSYQSYGLGVKLAAVVILGLCFVFIWSVFSPSSYSITYQRENFDDIREPISAANRKKVTSLVPSTKKSEPHKGHVVNKEDKKLKHRSSSGEKKKKLDGSLPSKSGSSWHKNEKSGVDRKRKGEDLKLPKKVDEVKDQFLEGSETEELEKENEEEKIENKKQEEEKEVVEGKENVKEKSKNYKQEGEEEEVGNGKEKEETETNKEDEEGGGDDNEEREGNGELTNSEQLDQEVAEKVEDEDEKSRDTEKKMKKNLGPIFDPKAHYTWNFCSTRSKHNYIPCIDIESVSGKLRNFRHHERSCPKAPQMCLVPLPPDGYETPVSWPESKSKILYKNVAHPKLAAFVKTENWVVESGEYLTFPLNQSMPKGGIQHYLDFIEEMVPDIEWGKNIRVVLDIGCKDSSFSASVLEKGVLTLTLGLKDDLVDLAQVALGRGFPAVVTPFGTRRLPFPSGVFDAIHCSDCRASWHSNGGKHLIEMNRILRPGGYFILSSKHSSIEVEEAMSTLTASICWNILADKTDEISDIRIKLYQKPHANDMYQLRRKKVPPLCKANENPDASWYVPIKSCLHTIPESIEQRGTEWPEEWPKRLETFPDWMNNREKLIADSEHWNAIVNNSYLVGLGIDWSNIRNVMDMKAINGGFAAALAQQKVWVMNVIPVHAPNTLPIVFERGLVGAYHDWCEAFGTYPRSYDLLHADHLFSRLKNRCKHPIVIVVEMDRILRPGGWAIIRDKVEILDPLESILRSLHWEIRMTFAKDKEGILCAQKTMWRP